MNKRILTAIVISAFSANSYADEGWSGYKKISEIDSLTYDNKVFVSLENYENSNCSNNRVLLTASSQKQFDQMFSLVMGAFYAGSKVTFYYSDTSNCESNRVKVKK